MPLDTRYEILGMPDPALQAEAQRFYSTLPNTDFLRARGILPMQPMDGGMGFPGGMVPGMMPPEGMMDPFAPMPEYPVDPMAMQRAYESQIVADMQQLDPTSPNFQTDLQGYFANHMDPWATSYPGVQAAINASTATHKELQQYLQRSPHAVEHYSNLVKGGMKPAEAMSRVRRSASFEPKDILERDEYWKALGSGKNIDPEHFAVHLQMRNELTGAGLSEDEIATFVNPESGTVDMDEFRKWRSFQARENPAKPLSDRVRGLEKPLAELAGLAAAARDPDLLHKMLSKSGTNKEGKTLEQEAQSFRNFDPATGDEWKNPPTEEQVAAHLAKLATKDAARLDNEVKARAQQIKTLGATATDLKRELGGFGFDSERLGFKAPTFSGKYPRPVPEPTPAELDEAEPGAGVASMTVPVPEPPKSKLAQIGEAITAAKAAQEREKNAKEEENNKLWQAAKDELTGALDPEDFINPQTVFPAAGGMHGGAQSYPKHPVTAALERVMKTKTGNVAFTDKEGRKIGWNEVAQILMPEIEQQLNPGSGAPSSGIVKVSSQAEYDALPAGTLYQDSTGKARRKK